MKLQKVDDAYQGTPAPSHLSKESQVWFQSVVSEWSLEDHHIKLLRLACESWDRVQQARRILKKEGLVYKDRFGQPRTHPAAAVERDSKISFTRILRELNLDLEEPRPMGRPPRGN